MTTQPPTAPNSLMGTLNFQYRTTVLPSDVQHINEIVRSTGFFREDEILIAIELIEERLSKGTESGYEFVFAEIEGKPAAYSCYGRIPCSLISYDLYWIVTHEQYRNHGIGRALLKKTEEQIIKEGGKSIYVETSSKPMYQPTCAFYEKNNYELKTRFEDFYEEGDDKLIYWKKIVNNISENR